MYKYQGICIWKQFYHYLQNFINMQGNFIFNFYKVHKFAIETII